MRGIIEAIYGRPWTWEDRHHVCALLGRAGMATYVYAPKDDVLHRERWREAHNESFLGSLQELATNGAMRVGFALSPGLSMDPNSSADRAALLEKLDTVARGVWTWWACSSTTSLRLQVPGRSTAG